MTFNKIDKWGKIRELENYISCFIAWMRFFQLRKLTIGRRCHFSVTLKNWKISQAAKWFEMGMWLRLFADKFFLLFSFKDKNSHCTIEQQIVWMTCSNYSQSWACVYDLIAWTPSCHLWSLRCLWCIEISLKFVESMT